eukprot:2210317-Amphidinium_carterae.1
MAPSCVLVLDRRNQTKTSSCEHKTCQHSWQEGSYLLQAATTKYSGSPGHGIIKNKTQQRPKPFRPQPPLSCQS